jgi:hypothetical protein
MSNLLTKKRILTIIILIHSFLSTSCDDKPPLAQDKFVKVYVDLLIIQDTTTVENYSVDSAKAVVFNKYSISAEQYDSTINYYNAEPDRWIEFFDSAGAYVERLKSSAGNQL